MRKARRLHSCNLKRNGCFEFVVPFACLQGIAPRLFITFDNDYRNETNPDDAHSRILMISVNETSQIAQEVWSWEAPVDYFTPFWGKADILPNGDRIGTFGTPTKTYNDTISAVAAEVDVQGQIVRT
jgi:Arylsulfotransferase (ASST)